MSLKEYRRERRAYKREQAAIRDEIYDEEAWDTHYFFKHLKNFAKFLVVVAVIAFLASVTSLEGQRANEQETKDAAIAIAETIELNKQYKDKTIKSDKTHKNYNAYYIEITEPGKIGVEYSCKRTIISRYNIVMWQLLEADSEKKISESIYHSFDVKMTDIKPGKYVILFNSASNEFGLDLFRRPYKFKVIFEKN